MDPEGHTGPAWDTDATEHPLDRVPVSQLTTDINDLVIVHIDAVVHSNERIPAKTLTPLVRHIHSDYMSPATLYALLASRLHFQQESSADPANAKLWRTRAQVCEELSLRLVADYGLDELAQNLVFEFYPLAEGSPIDTVPVWLRVSALELAIKANAKRLLSHPACVDIVRGLWDGHLVLDPYVHKVHRSDNVRTRRQLTRLMNARKGVVVRYDFEETTIFKPSRLRVPKYRDWMKLFNLAIIIFLYVLVMGPGVSRTAEILFEWFIASLIVDELFVLRAVGTHLYFRTLWSLCDFVTMILCVVYFLFKIAASLSEYPAIWIGWSHDVLAVCGVTLIPRLFSVLEASVGFSRTVISVRKMITELLWCWIAITMFSVGFWAALAHFGKGIFPRTKVFYDLVQIMFGFTPAVWQTWQQYPRPGALILFLYLFMAQFVVTTIVTAALSAKVVETKDFSWEEYHFLNAVRTEVWIKSERQVLYFYTQPWNVLCFFPLPLMRSVLPTHWYLQLNRGLLKLTHWHVFLGIYAYERLMNVLLSRRARAADIQQERVQRHLQHRMMKRAARQQRAPLQLRRPPNHANSGSASDLASSGARSGIGISGGASAMAPIPDISEVPSAINIGHNSMREAKFDLVEGLLNSPNPGAGAGTARSNPWHVRPPHPVQGPGLRRWSFDSERENASIVAPSEDLIDLQDIVRDLQTQNARLEEMLDRLLQQQQQQLHQQQR